MLLGAFSGRTNVLNRNLETAFYAVGLQMFNEAAFTSAGFTSQQFQTFQKLGGEEATHVTFLSGAISKAGGTPVPPCSYSFPASDVKSFLAVSAILEGKCTSPNALITADI